VAWQFRSELRADLPDGAVGRSVCGRHRCIRLAGKRDTKTSNDLCLCGRGCRDIRLSSKWSTRSRIGSLVAAIIVEFVAFLTLMPRIRVRGQRAVLSSTLAIVGAHFLIMLPAFGSVIALIGTLCVANAAAVWRWTHYRTDIAWLVDGLVKFGGGLILVATSPAFAPIG
jgi:hypothetical protein